MYNLAHINNLTEEERADCFTLIELLLPSGYLCCVSRGAMVCD